MLCYVFVVQIAVPRKLWTSGAVWILARSKQSLLKLFINFKSLKLYIARANFQNGETPARVTYKHKIETSLFHLQDVELYTIVTFNCFFYS